jgi:outer membrane receptor for ferrienterochelin and colicins
MTLPRLTLLAVALTQSAYGQETAPAAPEKVEQVEIKAVADSYDARREDTASRIVVGSEEIVKYGDTSVLDVLKRLPGVTVSGASGRGEIRMRGLGSGYTQILVNGERVPAGFSMDALAPDSVERIEIVRAATAEFSTQAIAGTINIVLKKVTSKAQHDLRLSGFRSRQSRNANAGLNLADKSGRLSYFVYAGLYGGDNESHSRGSGRLTLPSGELTQARETASDGGGSYRGVVLFPRLSWKDADGDELNLSGGLQSNRNGWSGRSHNDNQVGSFGNPDYVETLYRSPGSMSMMQGEVGWIGKVAGGKLDLKVSAERNRNDNDNVNELFTAGRARRLLRDWDSITRGHRASLRGKYTRSLFDGHALASGLDASVQDSEQTRERHDQLNGEAPTRIVEVFEPKLARLAAFVQDEWTVDRQLSVYLGARWEGVRTDSEATASDTGRLSTSSRNHVLSPVAQTLYKFPDDSGRQLRLALTRTYKAPTVEQLTARRYEAAVNTRFAADSGGNPGLRPELANGIDLSYEHFLKEGAMFSASVSRRAISDYIRTTLDLDADGRWVYRPVNDGDALVRSLQLEAKAPGKLLAAALANVDLRAGFSRNWSTVASVPGPGNRLDGQTAMSANFGIDYRKGDLTVGSSLAWQQGGWVRISEAQSQYQQTRRDLDAYLLYKFSPRYQLRVSANNILGQDFASDRIYNDLAGTSRETNFTPQSVRVGVNLEVKL